MNSALCEVSANADYPSAPWTLAGDAFVAVRAIASDVARAFMPRELRLVPVMPGKTIAIAALIRYGVGSTLQYHELIVSAALVRWGWRVGAWISHIYVDSEPSMLAGREIWGLPKQLAAFNWRRDGADVQARDLRVAMHVERSDTAARIPVLGPIFGSDEHSLKWSIASGSTGLGRVPGHVEMSGGGLDALGFDRVTALYRVESFRLTMKAPRISIACARARG